MEYDVDGRELPDQTPVDAPLNWKRPPTLAETIRAHIRAQLSQAASDNGGETFEEADDFDTGDDDEPMSPAEMAAFMADDLVGTRKKLRSAADEFRRGKVPQEYEPPPGPSAPPVPGDSTPAK